MLRKAGVAVEGGDIVFVRPDPSDWIGRLIAHATNGPYCHVRVAISHFEVIEALPTGIARTTLAHNPDPADVAAVGDALEMVRLSHALVWLMKQVNDGYGFLDIAADIVKALLPQRLGSRTPFLIAPRSFDCSQLGAAFLLLAGFEWLPDEIVLDAARCSPNDLARALGVLK